MLTDQQIQQLFDFCEKKYVRYYDVQIELVDHLASKIEKLQKQEPGLSFEAALERVYKEFGVMGFSTVVREKENQLFKQHTRHFSKTLLQQLYWPNILSVIAFAVVFYFLLGNTGSYWPWFYLVPTLTGIVIILRQITKISRMQKKSGKVFAFINSQVFPSLPVFFYIQLFAFQNFEAFPVLENHQTLINTIFLTVFFLFFKASLQTIKQSREYLITNYPSVFDFAE